MGMYTELVLKCQIKEGVPRQVKEVLHYLFVDQTTGVPECPNHPFFKTPRWNFVGSSGSFYHHPKPVTHLYEVDYADFMYIFSRSDLKNYDNEIALFLDWINPYLDHMPGECIGWTWYEEEEQPTLIYCKGNK